MANKYLNFTRFKNSLVWNVDLEKDANPLHLLFHRLLDLFYEV